MKKEWYAVKCLFSHPTRATPGEGVLYEERITLWQAESDKEAFALAESEARIYASEAESEFLTASDAFRLFDATLREGTEVYSTMRSSHLDVDLYRRTFCVTPSDRCKGKPAFGIENQ